MKRKMATTAGEADAQFKFSRELLGKEENEGDGLEQQLHITVLSAQSSGDEGELLNSWDPW